VDCSISTRAIHEYYSVTDELWSRYGPAVGMLCIGCLETRLGRRLVPADFTDAPINTLDVAPRSKRAIVRSARLLERLGRIVG
jgi:hypothetical protein